MAKAYALQAGREIRVIVEPSEIDDQAAALLSYEIAREIEDPADMIVVDVAHHQHVDRQGFLRAETPRGHREVSSSLEDRTLHFGRTCVVGAFSRSVGL